MAMTLPHTPDRPDYYRMVTIEQQKQMRRHGTDLPEPSELKAISLAMGGAGATAFRRKSLDIGSNRMDPLWIHIISVPRVKAPGHDPVALVGGLVCLQVLPERLKERFAKPWSGN